MKLIKLLQELIDKAVRNLPSQYPHLNGTDIYEGPRREGPGCPGRPGRRGRSLQDISLFGLTNLVACADVCYRRWTLSKCMWMPQPR
jgi:hypothetical protein